MSELFGIDIQGLVTDSLEGELHTVTITREGELPAGVEYDPINDRYEDENGDPVEPSDQTFTTEGVAPAYSSMAGKLKMIEAGLVESNEVPILMLAKPLDTEPEINDRITIDGKTYTMNGVIEKDPAGVTWIIRGKK